MTKPHLQSKTLWFNVAMLLIAMAVELAPLLSIVPEEWRDMAQAGLLVCSAVGNFILRLVTKTGLAG